MKPLEGIKVIDLSQFAAAPAVGRMMGEWGAEVIKVETAAGDGNRFNGAMCKIPIVSDDENPCFDTCSAFKKYTSINLKTIEGRSILDKMLETADVLIMSFREESARHIQVDYETIHSKFPRIVYVKSAGFGDEGPLKDVGGFDLTAYGARGGVTGNLSQLGGEPINPIPSFGDFQLSFGMCAAALAALIGREKTGVGDKIVGNLYNTALFVNSWAIMGTEGGNHYPYSRKDVPTPTSNTYMSSDGKWLQLCGPTYGLFYNRVMKVIGREDLIDNPRYCNWAKIQNEKITGEVVSIIEEAIEKRTADEWMDLFQAADIPCEKVYSFEDILADEHAWACHALQKVKYPSGNYHTLVSLPMQLNSVGVSKFEGHTSKRLGYHTKEVLKEYGYSEEQISDWAKKGVVID